MKRILALCAVFALLAAVVAASSSAAHKHKKHPRKPALSTCFWEGPISMKRPTTRGFDGHYFNFPEKSATYWLARFRLPAGTRLILHGRYSHSR